MLNLKSGHHGLHSPEWEEALSKEEQAMMYMQRHVLTIVALCGFLFQSDTAKFCGKTPISFHTFETTCPSV